MVSYGNAQGWEILQRSRNTFWKGEKHDPQSLGEDKFEWNSRACIETSETPTQDCPGEQASFTDGARQSYNASNTPTTDVERKEPSWPYP